MKNNFRKKLAKTLAIIFLISSCLYLTPNNVSATETPLPNYPGNDTWQLTFEDNFDGTTIDQTKWTYRDRDQYVYHDKTFATQSNGNLNLKIEKDSTGRVMLGRIDTHVYTEAENNDKFAQKYGFFECRAQVPPTDQTYFAFWFMAPGVEYIDGTGHDGCEIDATETCLLGDRTISTLHYDGYEASHRSVTSGSQTAAGIHTGYHTFGLEWDPDTLKFYYDGNLTWTYSGIAVPWVKEYIILSSGTGTWVEGNINNAALPYYAKVDYVRAWAKVDVAQNGNFETGALSPWTTYNNAGITNTNTYTNSSYAGYVSSASSLEQVITGLTPNTTYVYTADVKLQNSNESVKCGVKDFGGNETFNTVNSTTYGPTKVTFTTGPSSTSAKIYLYKPTGTGNAYIDEVSVVPQTSLVKNSSFETGSMTPWTSYNSSYVVNNNACTGTYAGCVDPSSSLEQVITGLAANTTYTYTADVKVENSANTVYIGAKDFGRTEIKTPVTSTGYNKYTVTFTTGLINTNAKIYLWNPAGPGKAYIDNAKVVKAQ